MINADILLVDLAKDLVKKVALNNLENSLEKLSLLIRLAQEVKTKELLEQYPEALIANIKH